MVSAFIGFLLDIILVRNILTVSAIRKDDIKINGVMFKVLLYWELSKKSSGRTATWKPRKRLPASPINNFACRWLNTRKPKIINDNKIFKEENVLKDVSPKPKHNKNINPPAKPSNPSSKLTELYIPINQMKKRMVTSTDEAENDKI